MRPRALSPLSAGSMTITAPTKMIAWTTNSQNAPRQKPAAANRPPSSGPSSVAAPQTPATAP
jgi:Ulp1 family protease